MRSLPKKFRYFFSSVTGTAALILGFSLYYSHWTPQKLSYLLVFTLLAVAGESLPVALPRGGFVTVTYAVDLAALILFPVEIALLVPALAGFLVLGKASADQTLFKRCFNASQFVISVKGAVLVTGLFGVTGLQFNPYSIIAYSAAALVFITINMTLVAVALGLMHDKSPRVIWLGNIRWSFPNFLALTPLGILMALIFRNYGPLGLTLLCVPLLLSRHSFQRYVDMRENYLNTIEALVKAIEAKDYYTRGHSDRVSKYSIAIAEELQLAEDRIESLKYASILHDVGKIGVSENILRKNEKLVEREWEVIRNHPVIGENIVKSIKFLYEIDRGVRHHHEKFDGTGYPDGLKGKEIPLDARIIAVADTYDAMVSDRIYRRRRSKIEALEEIRRVAGTQLDPYLVEVFLKALPKVDLPSYQGQTGGNSQEEVLPEFGPP